MFVFGERERDMPGEAYILMLESCEYLDLPQGPLAVSSVIERLDLLDGHFLSRFVVIGGTA